MNWALAGLSMASLIFFPGCGTNNTISVPNKNAPLFAHIQSNVNHSKVNINVQFYSEKSGNPTDVGGALQMKGMHPISLPLKEVTPSNYQASANVPMAGNWEIYIEANEGGPKYTFVQAVNVPG